MYNAYIYIYTNFRCHSKMMLTKILKSVFYNPFQNGVHLVFSSHASMFNLLNLKISFNGNYM